MINRNNQRNRESINYLIKAEKFDQIPIVAGRPDNVDLSAFLQNLQCLEQFFVANLVESVLVSQPLAGW